MPRLIYVIPWHFTVIRQIASCLGSDHLIFMGWGREDVFGPGNVFFSPKTNKTSLCQI